MSTNEEAQALTVREPAPVPAHCETPGQLLERAITSGANVEVLEKLMGLQERWLAAQAKRDFESALAAVKSELPPIVKNQRVDFTSSKGRTNYEYEDIADIASIADPIMSKHGLSYRWPTQSRDGKITVTCRISHRGGHTEDCATLEGPADMSGNKNAFQGIGSAVTYLQRYTLKAALGLAARRDDDGIAAGRRGHSEPSPTQRQPEPLKTPPRANSGSKQASSADVLPKRATDKMRTRMLQLLGQEFPDTQIINYAQAVFGCFATEWPLDKVPTTKEEMEVVRKNLAEWMAAWKEQNEAANVPDAQEDEPELPAEIAGCVIPVPRAKMKKVDYDKNPDTIGSLYREMKSGNEGARTRLWGLANEWPANGWTDSSGVHHPPTENEIICRKKLDDFLEFEERKKQMDLIP